MTPQLAPFREHRLFPNRLASLRHMGVAPIKRFIIASAV